MRSHEWRSLSRHSTARPTYQRPDLSAHAPHTRRIDPPINRPSGPFAQPTPPSSLRRMAARPASAVSPLERDSVDFGHAGIACGFNYEGLRSS
ncbi:hypothetical protein AAFF_G00268880 [Aldrovandia affinis]|uniref:Uncharacterized protein n=1 Tax=Aldrovandia affinis TaxID=143900 RepID=A0AAD7SS64_9TELE|nr:hypothetical protein AAFF_G00268880 [Aldrovandia affinis]